MAVERKTLEKSIGYLLKSFPCVAILGARQVGKTTLLKNLLPDSVVFDLEDLETKSRIENDLAFFLAKQKKPLIFDEAQEVPELFKALKVSIDNDRIISGQFIISGSSSPALMKNITESLAGRIAIFEMSGFDIRESWQKNESLLYKAIESLDTKTIENLQSDISYDQLIRSCIYGCYPEAFLRSQNNELQFKLWMENYFKTYVQRDIRSLFPGLSLQNYQRLIVMLSQNASEVLNISDFARSIGVSQPTIANYLQIAEATFLWRKIPVFSKKSKQQVIKHPKGYIRDSGLLSYNCRVGGIDQFMNQTINSAFFGKIWESFISEEIIKGFKNRLIPFDYSYYRTKNGVEVDLIIEGDFGIIPIEIKYGTITNTRKVKWLEAFVAEYKCPFGLIVSNAERASKIANKIFEIPAGTL